VKITGRSYRIKDKIVSEEPDPSERARN